ncbi:hypothetical protein LP420_18280 [Massilia sp. B-10]|nr:hypothetical protein LP420_18280 [Massilia sp. B-10]
MLVLLFRLLSKLPLRALHGLGAALGWLVYLASPSYRRRLRDNLTQAGFGQHLSQAIVESGKAIVELPFIWCAPPERVAAHATDENWDYVQSVLDSGQGIVFLTPHLGCFEITAQQIALRTPLTVMYRPPKKAALKPLIEGARAPQSAPGAKPTCPACGSWPSASSAASRSACCRTRCRRKAKACGRPISAAALTP